MRQRHQRQVLADHRRHLAAAIARRVDDVLGIDGPGGRGDAPDTLRQAVDRGDARLPVYRGAELTRAPRERLRQLRRIEYEHHGDPQAQAALVGLDEWMAGADLRRRQQLEGDALRARLRRDMAKLIDPLRAVRQADAAPSRGS